MAVLFSTALFSETNGDDTSAVRHGLYGFNSFLVGQSVVFFSSSSPEISFRILVLALTLPLVTVLVQIALRNSTFTLPFNIVMWLVMAQGYQSIAYKSLMEDASSASAGAAPTYFSDVNLFHATLRGFGQVFFASSTLSGFLVFLAVFINSRVAAVGGLVGSILGWTWCLVSGLDLGSVEAGLWGYNGVLTGIALSSVFMLPLNLKTAAVYFCALALTGFFQAALANQAFVPTGTVPFCLATMCIMATSSVLKPNGVIFVEDEDIGSQPEELMFRYWNRSVNNPQDASKHSINDFSMGRLQQYKKFLREMSKKDLDDTFHSLMLEEQSQHLVEGVKSE